MSDANQTQIVNTPQSFAVQGLPGSPAIRTIAYAAQTGNLEEAIGANGTKIKQTDVNGNFKLGDDTNVGGFFALGQSATAVATANSGTIASGWGLSRISPASAVTGLILAAGTKAGQTCVVVNEAALANYATFATQATSNVAGGANVTIPGGMFIQFVWDSVTSLWYPEATSGVQVSQRQNVISGQGATRTLLAAESGSTVLFDRAAGIVYTLPAPAIGLNFTFIVTTTITSNNAEVDTDAGTTFLLGAVETLTSASAVTFGAYANGTSTVKIQLNGTTKGGILGSQFSVVCVSATQWQISGILAGSGSEVTPFA